MKTGIDPTAPSSLSGTSLLLADERLTLEPHLTVHAYILVSSQEIAAALFSPVKNNFLALASAAGSIQPESLGNFLEATRLLQMGSVTRSRVIVSGAVQSLLPAELYRPDNAAEVLNYNFGEDPASVVQAQRIRCIDAQLLFRFPVAWQAACEAALPAPVYTHHLSGLAENFFLQHKNINETRTLLHLRQGFADVLVKRGRRLILLNSYACQSPEDVLYHTLNVYEQLQLNPEKDTLELAGAVEKDQALYALLTRYFRQPAFAARPSVAGYSYTFDSLSPHRYYSLFSQLLCES